MKRLKIVSLVLTASLLFSCFAMSGCDNKSRKDRDEDEISEEEDDGDSRRKPYDQNHRINGLTYDWLNGEPDYLEENGLVISDLGRFEFPMGERTAGASGIFYVPAFVKIEESTDGCEPGRKNIIATCTFMNEGNDLSGLWISAFDRYEGYTFEDNGMYFDLYEGCYDEDVVPKTFVIGDREVDVTWTFVSEQQEFVATITMTVNCPEDYDGVVFQYGPSDSAGIIIRDSLSDMDTRSYTIDEIGFSGNDYLYFTLEKTPMQST